MKVYLDDERPTPSGYIGVKTAGEAISILKTNKVTFISLDHDLGDESVVGTGYDVLLWIEEQVVNEDFIPPKMQVHTANASAMHKMKSAVESINRRYNERFK